MIFDRSPFTVHRSPFTVHRSPFTVHRSPSIIKTGITKHKLKASQLTLTLTLTTDNFLTPVGLPFHPGLISGYLSSS